MRLAILLFGLLAAATADRILLLVEDQAVKDSHSIFIKSLTDRGHKLSIRTADEPTLALFKHGELAYQHLIVFAPGVEDFGGSLSAKEIGRFVDAGGNLLVAASSNIGEAIRDLATETGFEFDEADTALIDHFNYDSKLDNGQHTTLVADKSQFMNARLITGDTANMNPVLFKGVALISDKTNLLKLEAVRAKSTAYSFNPDQAISEYPSAVGKQALLVGALQARNNARVVLTGSLAMFSNEYINAQVTKEGQKPVPSGNLAFVTALSKWVLKESGVLRVKSVEHHKVGEKKPTEYTIMDEVEYAITIEELTDGKWGPFQGKDVQLEFVRIDPFVRTTLKNTNGRLTAKFKLPDVYGVYKFMVDYRRIGYTHLYDVQQLSVRPLWHTQYERFIRSAYPYYASAFSMMIGVVLFSIVFLYHKDSPQTQATQAAAKKKD
ncbi:hypothetical protein WR25_02468 [Diploscapter pachys]|uniref:Dolichyl-diphosphooligosaccharide--protein glycosyltransferase 48 kDa subunit n=1 Tax=Diploscapter pachys TaxID=2018661 RepID=A0A2A2KKD4_9BILA|nr:hypothetical protein WR25_02468 [Diploscapter pachys]